MAANVEHTNTHTGELPPGSAYLVTERRTTGGKELNLYPIPSPDPNEPLNWSPVRKIVNYSLVLSVSLLIFTALSIQTIFWQLLVPDLGVTYQQLNNAQSINSAGCTAACVIFIPFAIKYGRRPIYILSTAIMFGMSIWSARMRTKAELYATSLFMGLAGATNEAMVGMTIADLFFVHQRGTMNGLYLIMVMTGSFLTPLISGVQATQHGWRWCYWTMSIFNAVILLLFLFLYEETKYIPSLDGRTLPDPSANAAPENGTTETDTKSPDIAEATVHPAGMTRTEPLDGSIPLKTRTERLPWITRTDESLWRLVYQPFVILFTFPDVLFAALQYGTGLVWLINLSVTTTVAFSKPPYLFTPDKIGYLGVGPFVGNLLGSIYCGYFADRAVIWYAKRNGGLYEPEMRLYLLHVPSVLLCVGLMIYGVTLAKYDHWIVPTMGAALFAFGLGAFGDTVLTYVIDSHKRITGEAFVAIAVVRNIFSVWTALVRTDWQNGMGIRNMYLLQGGLALFFSLLFIPMIIWGKWCRQKTAAKYYKLAERRV